MKKFAIGLLLWSASASAADNDIFVHLVDKEFPPEFTFKVSSFVPKDKGPGCDLHIATNTSGVADGAIDLASLSFFLPERATIDFSLHNDKQAVVCENGKLVKK